MGASAAAEDPAASQAPTAEQAVRVAPAPASSGRLGRLLHLSDQRWAAATALSAPAMVGIWIAARLVATAGLAIPGPVGAVGAAVVLVAFALLAIAAAVVGPIQARGRHGAPPWDVASVAVSVASIGLFIEAMAAVSAAGWRVSGLPVSAWGGLGKAELFYLRLLAESIPLLDLPAAVGWRAPAFADAHIPPALRLVFMIAVIVPLLRIVVEGYRLVVDRVSQRAAVEWVDWNRFDRLFEAPTTSQVGARRRRAALIFVVFLIKALLLGGAWYLACQQAFTPDSWLNERWEDAIGLLPFSFDRLTLVPQAIVLILAVWMVRWLIDPLDHNPIDTRLRVATPIAQTLAAVFGVALFLGGLLLFLLNLGVAGPATGPRPMDDMVATLSWHLVAALPAPDAAATLDWQPPVDITGSWHGWFALLPKILLLGSVILVWLPGIKIGTFRQRYGPVMEFWFAATVRELPGVPPDSTELTTAFQTLSRRPEFASLIPAAERLRGVAASSGSDSDREEAANNFLAAVDSEAPDCGQALRSITRRLRGSPFSPDRVAAWRSGGD